MGDGVGASVAVGSGADVPSEAGVLVGGAEVDAAVVSGASVLSGLGEGVSVGEGVAVEEGVSVGEGASVGEGVAVGAGVEDTSAGMSDTCVGGSCVF